MLQPKGLNDIEQASAIITKAAELASANHPFALITSLAIEGGAAREVGSLAMVDATGEMTGYLSNGCIDHDIRHHAATALRTKTKKLIRYGDGSRYVDLKLPCGGALTVLIDPAPDIVALQKAATDFAARRTVSLTFIEPAGGEAPARRSFTYRPTARLVLAGRGAIFRRMTQLGHATGYEVYALSPELDDLAAVRPFLSANPSHLTSPQADIALDMLDAHTAFLTLFHDHDWEPALLKIALGSSSRFIGSLGSRRTHEMRKQALRQMHVPPDAIARLRGPIGLVPSLRDAPSIAVSALAEVVAAFQD